MQNDSLNINQYLDKVLKTEPGYDLSDEFEAIVLLKAKKRRESIRLIKDFFIYLGTFVILSGILIGFAWFLRLETITNLLKTVPSSIGWLTGFAGVGLFVLFVDKVVLPYLFLTRSLKK